jgi:hypothetical protein
MHSRIEQQLSRDGAGFENMGAPTQRHSLTSDMMKETNNMALVTSKVVVKMNKLEEKLDQQVAVLKRSVGKLQGALPGRAEGGGAAGERS